MSRLVRPLPAVLLVAATAAAAPSPTDWPRFRGPNGTGATAGTVPTKFGPGKALAWSAAVPGVGHSSPVVVGDRLFLQTASADGAKRTLLCLSAADGTVRWAKDAPGKTAHTHKKNSLASSTPASDGERVFALFWDGKGVTLHAYDLDGKPLWSQPLGGFTSDHGAGMSPVVVGRTVVVSYDQGAKADDGSVSEVLGFDAATGAKKWAAPRKSYRASSASPVERALPGGKVEAVVASTAAVTGYDPETGSVNWTWAWDWSAGKGALRAVASPILLGDKVFATTGDGGGSRAGAVLAPAAGGTVRAVWERRKDTPYVPTPIAHGSHLYWLTDTGFATCADAATGEVVWSERVLNKGVTASPVLVGDVVVGFAEDGAAVGFKATPAGLEKVADGSVGEPVFASPAAAGGRLFVRGDRHLFCYKLAK